MTPDEPLPTSHPHWQMPFDGAKDDPSPLDADTADEPTDALPEQSPLPDLDPPGWSADIANHHNENARKARLYDQIKALADAGKEGAAIALLKSGS